MPELDVAWATDIAILELSGSSVEDRGDHLILRSPENPRHHWGNCVFVRDPGTVDEAERWLAVFRAAFPLADWIAVGLPKMPDDVERWAAGGLLIEPHEVLATPSVPLQTPLAGGYEVRRLEGDDWEQTIRLSSDENRHNKAVDPERYESFARTRAGVTRALCDAHGDVAAYFGAFADGRLAAQLGIVCCGTAARYQQVLTDHSHRRRGLASHLVGVAGRWSAERGCDRWVIVTDAGNPAGSVYRRVGFEPKSTYVQAYLPRPPYDVEP
jgi:GNAT superfamily N-acetyltransferase